MTTQVSFRVDKDLKSGVEEIFDEMGINMSTAITMFLVKVKRERKIPFEITADPFYSESNVRYLEQKLQDYKEGKLKFTEHELIED